MKKENNKKKNAIVKRRVNSKGDFVGMVFYFILFYKCKITSFKYLSQCFFLFFQLSNIDIVYKFSKNPSHNKSIA